MRICVASRIPKIVPSMVTVSSSRSCRTSASLSGVRSFISICHLSVRGNDGGRALSAPALDVHGNRVVADVRVRPLDVHRECRRAATETLRADAGLIDVIEKLALESRDLGVRIYGSDLAKRTGFFCEPDRDIGRAAQADAHNHGRARFRARFENALQYEFLDALAALRWIQHPEKAHILRA